MKKILHLSVAVVLMSAIVSLSSCSKPLVADYTVADIPMCMSAATLGLHYQYITYTINHNDIVTALNSAGAKDITRVTSMSLKQMNAQVTTAGGNLDQIANVEVYFKTTNTPNDSIQIAYSSTMNAGDTQNVLQLNGGDLKAALSYDPIITFKVITKITGNTTCLKLTGGIIEMNIRN